MLRSYLLILAAFGAFALSAGEVKLVSVADPAQISDTPGGESLVYPDPSGPVKSERQQNRISTDGRFIVFESNAENLVPAGVDGNGASDVFVYDRFNGTVSLVSINANGTQSGNGLSRDPVISRNGRFVAYVSESSDLVANGIDANDNTDIFVRDLVAETTSLVSINALGSASGNGASNLPCISDDGRFVAFQSFATNLDPAITLDNLGGEDVFVRDRLNGTTKTCSTSTVGTAAAGNSNNAAISGDGTRVIFFSTAANIVASGDSNSSTDIYAFRTSDGLKQLVSAIDGTNSNNRDAAQGFPLAHISQTGKYVTFVTNQTLTATASDDSGGLEDIYRRDLDTTITLHVTVKPGDTSAEASISAMSVTPDGMNVVFATSGQDLIAKDANPEYPNTSPNILLAKLGSGIPVLSIVSSSPVPNKSGGPIAADEGCDSPSISDDGSTVVFQSFADNLTSDTVQFRQIFLRKTGRDCELISVQAGTAQSANGESIEPAISGDGNYVVYGSSSTNLVTGISDNNGNKDIFLRDRASAQTSLISARDPSSASVTGAAGSFLNFAARNKNASQDGRYVVFTSAAQNLVSNVAKGAGFTDVYVRDTVLEITEAVSVNVAGTQTGNASSSEPYISADGRYVVFTSFSSDLVATATGNIYIRDRLLQQTETVSVRVVPGASSSQLLDVSQDGTKVLFSSINNGFTADTDSNATADLFVRDTVAKTTTLVSKIAGGGTGVGVSDQGKLSDDGNVVVFASTVPNLVSGVTDINSKYDVFVRNISTDTTVLASPSIASSTTTSNAASISPQISGNGLWVAFTSTATNLVTDPNQISPSPDQRVYARSLVSNTTKLACHKVGGVYSQTAGVISTLMHIDGSGSKILFASTATDLVSDPDTNGGLDLFVFETGTNLVRLVSLNVGGTEAATKPISMFPSYQLAVLSTDGRWVVFASDASNMVANGIDGNSVMDVFARNLATSKTHAISLSKNGVTTGNKQAAVACISRAGNSVLFAGTGDNHVENDFNSAIDVFTLALDNLPTFTPLPIVGVLEDAAPTTVDLSQYFSDVETPNLAYSVAGNSNAALFSSVTILAGKNLKLTYAPDAFGLAQITVRATDSGGLSTDAILSVTVTGVNDAPSFTKGADVTTTEAATVNTVVGWATNLAFGPPNENTQAVAAFVLTADQPQFFAVQPAIAANGTLTFTPAGNLNDPATVIVTVQLKDNGGTLNGGVDTSAAQTFAINLSPVADTLIVLNRNDVGANSLRDCLNRARKGDSVLFDPVVFDPANSDAATVIDILSELPALDDGGVALDATGRRVTLNGGAAGSSSGLVISAAGNTVRGLNIIAFNRAGIVLQGSAANNIVGGSRLVGGGPNGQGLRISGNGSAGLDLKGSGVTGNVVKGCWIGLDAAGTGAQPNLTGVLIEGGAAGNTIGGIDPGDANVISGNQFEGVTASDEGSDDNTIISNIVGATGVLTSSALSRDLEDDLPQRSALANGSSGVFLSKGTKGTMVGGPTTASSNAIAFNGGNGVEVRDTKTRRNAMRGNRIKKNKSGIALIDGANDGLKAPTSEEFTTSASTTATKIKVSARGSVSGNEGVVELFNDDGDQGETFVTRCAVTGGKWYADFEAFRSKKVTATYTDASGNTSAFVIVGDGAGGGGSGPGTNLDSDGDGFSDELEVALGTSPTDATSTPLEGAPMGTPAALSLTSIQIKLNFLKPAADSIKIAGALPTPDGFVLAGAKVSTSVGGAAKTFTLDAKGGGVSGSTKFKLAKPKLGLAKFTATYAKETYSQLGDEGLTGTEDVLKQNRTVKVLVIFNGAVYAADRTVLYSAKKGKTGSAK